MPILRTLESVVRPGKRQQWGALIKDVKKIVDKHGSPLRVLQLQFGGHPGTVISSTIAEDWASLAARTQKINADAEFQAILARGSIAETADVVEVRLANDITSEVGTPGTTLQGAQVIQVMAMKIKDGKRAKQLETIRQLREARAGAGRPVANVLEQVAGDANVLYIVWGYADLNAWAKDREAGQPKGFEDIQKRAQADPQFPYAETIGTRVFTDITNQL